MSATGRETDYRKASGSVPRDQQWNDGQFESGGNGANELPQPHSDNRDNISVVEPSIGAEADLRGVTRQHQAASIQGPRSKVAWIQDTLGYTVDILAHVLGSAISGCLRAVRGLGPLSERALVVLGTVALVFALILGFKILGLLERHFLNPLSSAVSALGSVVGLLSSVPKLWADTGTTPTMILRDAVAVTSAADNAATHFVSEISSVQQDALSTVPGALFSYMAVPTAVVAKVEQRIDTLQSKLVDRIPKEFAGLDSVKRVMEHIINDLAPENNQDERDQLALRQKMTKHGKAVRRNLKELINLVAVTIKHRENVREDAREIKKRAGYAKEAWEELGSDIKESKQVMEKHLIDAGGNGDDYDAESQENQQRLVTRIDDLAIKVWLQEAEMKARKDRAEKFAAACHLEMMQLRSVYEEMVLLLGRLEHDEVGALDAAKQVLDWAKRLIESIEKNYL